MPTIEKISIALPPEMVSVVRQAVEAGEYASSSEVVRDALRDWTQKRAMQREEVIALRRIWQKARADARPGVPAEEVMDRLARKYRSLAAAAKK